MILAATSGLGGISIHIPTEFVDLQNSLLGVADHSVQSLNGSEAAVIPRWALLELQDSSPSIRLAMWVETLIDASIFREWVVNVGRRDSKARIAQLLCEITLRLEKIRYGDDGSFEFPLTQEQLADCTGLPPVHQPHIADAAQRRPRPADRRSLKVLDWDGPRKVGDFDELYLHQLPEAIERASASGSAANRGAQKR